MCGISHVSRHLFRMQDHVSGTCFSQTPVTYCGSSIRVVRWWRFFPMMLQDSDSSSSLLSVLQASPPPVMRDRWWPDRSEPPAGNPMETFLSGEGFLATPSNLGNYWFYLKQTIVITSRYSCTVKLSDGIYSYSYTCGFLGRFDQTWSGNYSWKQKFSSSLNECKPFLVLVT